MSEQVIFTSIFGTAYRVAGEMRLRSSNVPCLAIALAEALAAERAAREAAERERDDYQAESKARGDILDDLQSKAGATWWIGVGDAIAALREQLEDARETNRHLNRRCQEAESKLHQWLGHLQRGCNAVRYEADRLKEWADDNMLRRHMVDAKAKVDRYRNAVAKFLNARNHDLCHENRRELAEAFGLFDHMRCDVSADEFAAGCQEYQRQLFGRSPTQDQLAARDAELATCRQQCADELHFRTQAENRADGLEQELAKLRERLTNAWDRMDRARNILTKGDPTPMCNWGMLDTSLDRAALTESEAT